VAREENQRLVEGKWIYLVLGTPPRDRSGLLLAYVWVNSLFVNAALIQRGCAEATSTDDHQYLAHFRALEEGARRDGRGLWGNGDVLTYYRPRLPEADVESSDYRGHPPNGSGRVFSGWLPSIPALPRGTQSSAASSLPITSPGLQGSVPGNTYTPPARR
jgi:hypothetical protein